MSKENNLKKGDLVEINHRKRSVYAGLTGEYIAICEKSNKHIVYIQDLGILFFDLCELMHSEPDKSKKLKEARAEISVLIAYKKQADNKINELECELEKLKEVTRRLLRFHNALVDFEAEHGTAGQLIYSMRTNADLDDGLLELEYTVNYYSDDCAEAFHTATLRPEEIDLLELGSEVRNGNNIYIIKNKTRTVSNTDYSIYNIHCRKVS